MFLFRYCLINTRSLPATRHSFLELLKENRLLGISDLNTNSGEHGLSKLWNNSYISYVWSENEKVVNRMTTKDTQNGLRMANDQFPQFSLKTEREKKGFGPSVFYLIHPNGYEASGCWQLCVQAISQQKGTKLFQQRWKVKQASKYVCSPG